MSYVGEKLKVQFSLNQVLKQVDAQAEKYNPKKGRYEPVFNEDGSPEMVLRSYIKLPAESRYSGYAISTEQKIRQVIDYDPEKGTEKVSTHVRRELEFDTYEKKTETLYGLKIERDRNGDPLRDDEGKVVFGELITLQLTGKELVAEFDLWRNRPQEQNVTYFYLFGTMGMPINDIPINTYDIAEEFNKFRRGLDKDITIHGTINDAERTINGNTLMELFNRFNKLYEAVDDKKLFKEKSNDIFFDIVYTNYRIENKKDNFIKEFQENALKIYESDNNVKISELATELKEIENTGNALFNNKERDENEEVESVLEFIKSEKEQIEKNKHVVPGMNPKDLANANIKPNRGANMIL